MRDRVINPSQEITINVIQITTIKKNQFQVTNQLTTFTIKRCLNIFAHAAYRKSVTFVHHTTQKKYEVMKTSAHEMRNPRNGKKNSCTIRNDGTYKQTHAQSITHTHNKMHALYFIQQ